MRTTLLARGLLLGAAYGALWLGAGGRLAMWGFAVLGDRPPSITVTGSLRVVLAGAIMGVPGGALFWLLGRRLPLPRLPRGVLFGALFMVLLSPGIVPHQPLTFALFAPCFLLFGVSLSVAWASLEAASPTPVPRKGGRAVEGEAPLVTTGSAPPDARR